jgi:hypothetical protein
MQADETYNRDEVRHLSSFLFLQLGVAHDIALRLVQLNVKVDPKGLIHDIQLAEDLIEQAREIIGNLQP